MPSIDEIADNFAFLDDWEERYRYVIELGRALPPMDDALKTPETKVRGCTSQVWLVARREGDRLFFIADSDAAIVKGLVAILLALYSGKSAAEIISTDAHALFEQLQLKEHLSPSRSNGFYAMAQRIGDLARVE